MKSEHGDDDEISALLRELLPEYQTADSIVQQPLHLVNGRSKSEPSESKPSESKPSGSEPSESKPSESKPSEFMTSEPSPSGPDRGEIFGTMPEAELPPPAPEPPAPEPPAPRSPAPAPAPQAAPPPQKPFQPPNTERSRPLGGRGRRMLFLLITGAVAMALLMAPRRPANVRGPGRLR